jgi:hypothetical protein
MGEIDCSSLTFNDIISGKYPHVPALLRSDDLPYSERIDEYLDTQMRIGFTVENAETIMLADNCDCRNCMSKKEKEPMIDDILRIAVGYNNVAVMNYGFKHGGNYFPEYVENVGEEPYDLAYGFILKNIYDPEIFMSQYRRWLRKSVVKLTNAYKEVQQLGKRLRGGTSSLP